MAYSKYLRSLILEAERVPSARLQSAYAHSTQASEAPNTPTMSSLDTALLNAEQAKAANANPSQVRVVVVNGGAVRRSAPQAPRKRGCGRFCCAFLLTFWLVSYFTYPRQPRATWVQSTFTLSVARPPLSIEHTYSVMNNNFQKDTMKNLEVVQYYCASADRVSVDRCTQWTPLGASGIVDDGSDAAVKTVKGRHATLMSRSFYFAEMEAGTLVDLRDQCFGEDGVLMMTEGDVNSKRMGTVAIEASFHQQFCVADEAPAEPVQE